MNTMKKLWNWIKENVLNITALLVLVGIVSYIFGCYLVLTGLLVLAVVLQVIQNMNWIKQNVLRTFVYISVVVAILMIILYFLNFHKGLSDEDSSWSNFGSYFASITGLMAFAGVMYTASQSDDRAKTAKNETIVAKEEAAKKLKVQEDRDVFFKMLELYQKQVAAISFDDKNGIDAFALRMNDIDSKIVMYIIYDEIKNDRINFFKDRNEDLKKIMYRYDKLLKMNIVDNKIINGVKKLITSDIKFKSIQILFNKKNSRSYFYYYGISTDIVRGYNDINILNNYVYNTMRYIADCIYKDYGYFLGQYYRNVHYFMAIISEAEDDKKYSKIFRAQLSRYELILLLYNAVSSQSSRETVALLIKYDMFNNIIGDDIFLFVHMEFKFDVKIFIDNLLNKYLEDPINKKE
jgi:hypothetical protein